MAYEPRPLCHMNGFIGGGGGLQFVESKPQSSSCQPQADVVDLCCEDPFSCGKRGHCGMQEAEEHKTKHTHSNHMLSPSQQHDYQSHLRVLTRNSCESPKPIPLKFGQVRPSPAEAHFPGIEEGSLTGP